MIIFPILLGYLQDVIRIDHGLVATAYMPEHTDEHLRQCGILQILPTPAAVLIRSDVNYGLVSGRDQVEHEVSTNEDGDTNHDYGHAALV